MLDQQERWAHFVAVLGRVAEYLREELPSWWQYRPQRVWNTKQSRVRSARSKRTSYTSSDESGCESLHSSIQQRPAPSLSHPRDISTQITEAEAANAQVMVSHWDAVSMQCTQPNDVPDSLRPDSCRVGHILTIGFVWTMIYWRIVLWIYSTVGP